MPSWTGHRPGSQPLRSGWPQAEQLQPARRLARVPVTSMARQIRLPSPPAAPRKAKGPGKLSMEFILSQLPRHPQACICIANKSQPALPTLPSSDGGAPPSPSRRAQFPSPQPGKNLLPPKFFLRGGHTLACIYCRGVRAEASLRSRGMYTLRHCDLEL